MGRLQFDVEVLEWARDMLHASYAHRRREHEDAIKYHQADYKRLQDGAHAVYVDKRNGAVDLAFYEAMSNQWREEDNCHRIWPKSQVQCFRDRTLVTAGIFDQIHILRAAD